jgi:type II secretory pathway pseudopilin PulG
MNEQSRDRANPSRDRANPSRDRQGAESGFALLLVFLMAAMIAITLYSQIPRVAFQSQRQKEQLLIERGEQYQRAIQLFVRANNRYPSKIEDLENFNNHRYLRHRFKDPMTGKEEWRLIHVNAAGVFTDSIANKKKQKGTDKDTQASQNDFVGEQAFIVTDTGQQGPQGNVATTRRRQSEGGAAPVDANGQPLFPAPNLQQQNADLGNAPPPFPGAQPGVPGQPGQDANNLQLANEPPNPATVPGVPGVPGQPLMQGLPGQPQPTPGAIAGGTPGAPFPGVTVSPDTVNNLNNSLQAARPGLPGSPQQPGAAGFPQPGAGAFPQPGAGAFPQAGGVQNPSQNAAQNSTNTSSSFVGGNSFVGGDSSFVGGGGFVGSSSPAPTSTNPIPGAQPGAGVFPGNQPGFQPGVPQPGVSQPFGQPTTPQQSFAPQQNFSQPGQTPGFAQPGTATAAGGQPFGAQNQTAAQNLLSNLLTSPRQGGIAGGQPATTGQQIGAGIAGVASTSEAPSIMEYNDNTHYNEWEFIFDITKQKQTANPLGVAGTPAAALGSTPGGAPGTTLASTPQGAASASPFGGTGLGGSSIGGSQIGGTTPGGTTGAGTSGNGQTTPGGAPAQQQQSPIPTWFRFGEP